MAYNKELNDMLKKDEGYKEYRSSAICELKSKKGKITVFPAIRNICVGIGGYALVMAGVNAWITHSTFALVESFIVAGVSAYGAYKANEHVRIKKKDEEEEKKKILEDYAKQKRK